MNATGGSGIAGGGGVRVTGSADPGSRVSILRECLNYLAK